MSAVAVIGQDGLMDSSAGPRAGGPRPRRSFTAQEKLDHLAAYEAACADNGGGAYLRAEGLYSSQVTEWRRLRDAGVLEGKAPGERIGRPSAEQAELTRRRLAKTEVALDIMGKAHALLDEISESADTEPRPFKR
jgi:transposase-like protein